ncbi:ATP-grasp fold amidoligase family protein [Treponema bryantii]|uniref:ATP-grasp fold amidoligase family protein n=1 Tax=Treponema bryantii TaxID=163 RepID=UPI002B2C153F|nr:glycosyl transferase [Treponema bryantii]
MNKSVIKRMFPDWLLKFIIYKPWMNDEKYLKYKFKKTLGRELNLDSPKSFNEKIQWLKIHDRNPDYTRMVDKYEAKKYVASIIGEEYIIPNYGVWNKFEDIDFNSLPEQFVLKTTHDSGGVSICRDKTSFDYNKAKIHLKKSLKNNFYYMGREWPYKDVKPRILAEKYMEDSSSKELVDYKFYCFDGIPKFLYISKGLEYHPTASISFVNLNWTFAPYERSDYKTFDALPERPSKFDEMIEICKKLSTNHKFLRVDLYQINNHIYFSELTFSPCSGMMPFKTLEQDLEMGDLLKI